MNELAFNFMLLVPLTPLFGNFKPADAELTFYQQDLFLLWKQTLAKSRVTGRSIERK
jgi:hypothetical protein